MCIRDSVINLVGAGTDQPHLYTTAYDSSKAGVIRLTEALAREGGEHGLKTFAVFPGTVRTAMTEFILESPEGRKWRPSFGEIFAEGRDLGPEIAAEFILHLLSGRADALSGRWLDATRGVDDLIGRVEQLRERDIGVLRMRG